MLLPLWLASTVGAAMLTDQNVCVVKANGNQKDDVPNIITAFRRCGNGATIVFPEDQSYWIASRLNPILNDVVIQWHGQWTVSHLFLLDHLRIVIIMLLKKNI